MGVSMNGIWLLVGVFGFLGLWIIAMRRPSAWQQLVMQSVETRDLEPLLRDLERKPSLVQPRFYDEAMQYFLQHNLDLAVALTLRFVPIQPDHALSQEWMEFLASREETAECFSSEFLTQYRRTGCATGSG